MFELSKTQINKFIYFQQNQETEHCNNYELAVNYISCSEKEGFEQSAKLSFKLSFLKFIVPIERAFKFSALSPSQKDSIRHLDANTINFNSNLPMSKVNKTASSCIKNLQTNVNVNINKADKGGQVIIMDKSDYLTKIQQLNDNGPY